MGVRDRVAEVIQAELPEFTVYPHPPDVADVPAIAIMPADPYQTPVTFGRNGASGIVAWSFEIQIVTPRADVESSLAEIEDLRVTITRSLAELDGSDPDGVSGARWGEMSAPGTDMVGEIPVLVASMAVFVKATGP